MSIKVRIELRRLKVLKEKKNKSRGIFSAFLFLNSAIGLLLSVDFEIQKANFKANNFCMNMKTNKKCKYMGCLRGERDVWRLCDDMGMIDFVGDSPHWE